MSNRIPFILALLLGASMTLAYAPFSFWPLVPLALAGYFYLLSQSGSEQAFKLGFCFGLGWFGAGISWVHVSIADFGGIPLFASVSLMLLLCSYLALFPAFASKMIKKYFSCQYWPLALPFMWLISEGLRGYLLTGFPWLSLGYSQLHSPLSGWLPVIGEFGVSALVVLLAAVFAVWLPQKKYLASGVMAGVTLLSGWVLNQHQWSVPKGDPVAIAMVQGNIQQVLRWAPEQDQPTMQKYKTMTEDHWDNQVIIWPEAAIPQLEAMAGDYITEMDKLAVDNHVGMISGVVNYNFETREAYNNLIVFGAKKSGDKHGHYRYQHANRFAKHHLLPIGEFIPMEDWLRGLAPIFDLPMSSFSRGDFQQANLLANGYHFSPAICFEIAFPSQISANLYADTDFIITVSNDAWFGRSHGPAQHLEIAQTRAKEFGLPVLRATNNGITAFIDHRGNIQSRLPQFEAAVLSDEIQPVTGTTPYRYFGNLIAWLFTAGGLVMALWLRSKSNS
ncbi:MAG: apolipoprotein N-acyltransferase [Paraglaciecola sp.]|jgi:apolipoprotein N-acyltransferase